MRDIRRHFRPHGLFGNFHYPATDFAENIWILAHRGAHLSFGQTVRAGHVELERVAAGVLAALDDLVPRVVVVLFHDRGDENASWILVLNLLELFDPSLEAAIGAQLDILPAVDFAGLAAPQPRVTRLDVDHLAGIKTDRFADNGAPAFVERFADDVGVRARRAGADNEGVGKFEAVNRSLKSGH